MEFQRIVRWIFIGLLSAFLLTGITGCDDDDDDCPTCPTLSEEETDDPVVTPTPAPTAEPSQLLNRSRALFGTLPEKMPGESNDTPAMIALGEKLYFEQAISVNKTQSCNDCHPLNGIDAGADNLPTSPGAKGKQGPRNSPTVLNAGYQFNQFWDGRAGDLAEQAKGPILNPIEMGMPDEQDVLNRLNELGYEAEFAAAFPNQNDPVVYDNVGTAIAAFERTLKTRNRLDLYLAGNEAALTDEQKAGLELFIDKGCVQCHNGPLLGGMFYEKVGIFGDYPYIEEDDHGRYGVTGDPADMNVFKVPMLREVALTSPYFHNGQVATMGEAVDLMARLQLNETLDREEIHSILRFLVILSDIQRTTAPPPPEAVQQNAWWNRPNFDNMPNDQVRYGYELLTRTYNTMGPGAEDESMRYTGNMLMCSSCHQEAGTKRFGLTWIGVSHRYPKYRNREAVMSSIEDRINGCMQRSMNGEPLPKDGEEMKAIVAFFDWMSQGVPEDLFGVGRPTLYYPNRRANLGTGGHVYTIYCQSCHGSDGMGYSAAPEEDGALTVPALWGDGVYNIGAGMHRLLTSAEFARVNMPLGTRWDQPAITDEQAYDVSGYYNSFPHPSMENLEEDYPDLTTKPIDSPYPPYADDFSQEQHKYGPYPPIKAYYDNL